MGLTEARAAIQRARNQLERVQVASWDPADPEQAVMWAFYAYENCVVAAAEVRNIKWTKIHWEKASLARRLHREGVVSRDVGDDLERLNELRKDVAYGEPGEALVETDLEDLATGLESFVEAVASLIEEAARRRQ